MELKISEIKTELQIIGVKISGKKMELVERLIGNKEEFGLKYRKRYLGAKELKDNDYVPYLHWYKNMSAWDMNYYLNIQVILYNVCTSERESEKSTERYSD